MIGWVAVSDFQIFRCRCWFGSVEHYHTQIVGPGLMQEVVSFAKGGGGGGGEAKLGFPP